MAKKMTFRGGIRLGKRMKASEELLRRPAPPAEIAVSLLQWQGKPDHPVVQVGEDVLRGQKIGEPRDADGCPVFSGVSGRVTAIELLPSTNDAIVPFIRIQNDRKNRAVPASPFQKALHDVAPDELIEQIRAFGVIDAGNPAIPLHAKLRHAREKADTLIVNCAESDPCLSLQYALLAEKAQEIVNGAKIMMAAARIGHAYLVIGECKLALLHTVKEAIGQSDLIEVLVTREKYPQSDERLLLSAVAGRELPAHHTPEELGYTVVRAESCAALFEAMLTGMPQTERIVTVGGDAIASPENLQVTIGTRFSELISFCGASADPDGTTIEGGVMTGCAIAADSAEAVVTAQTAGVLVFKPSRRRAPSAEADPVSAFLNRLTRTVIEPSCIRCGRCVFACPMQLFPFVLADAAQRGDFARCRAYHIESCIECGACAYVCPAGIRIVERIHTAVKTETGI